MKKYLLSFAVMVMGSTLLTGCLGDDSKSSDIPTEVVVTKGVFIINNGSATNSIDGSLTYINYATTTPSAQQNVYQMVNGESLGGTANDVLVYGQKVYIVGYDENTIFVLDARNSQELKKVSTIDLLGEEDGKGPRRVEAFDGKVYFTTYGTGDKGCVAAIDTTSFALQKKYQVGSHPEGLTFGIDDKNAVSLYVANSDWSMGKGSISKIDMTSGSITNSEYDKVKNPQEIAVAGDVLYVLDYGHYDTGDYTQHDAGVYKISNNTVSLVIPNATGMAAAGYLIYTFNDPFGSTAGPSYSVYDIRSSYPTTLNLFGDSSHPIVSPAAIAVDPMTGNIFIASRQKDPDTGYPSYAIPGFVNVYQGYGINSNPGQFVESFQTGVEPHMIEFSYGTAKIIY